ncbi:hypothetical protein [uncultured Dysgonomonas sp.]|uniref:Uncharacterized protein n=1 Tax=uncultured Dysgonomonas sp. TaxID=206096 RepID=A0A212IXC3_9BACT|nr:hypothetical protein [uncultured Dysgonomonas sp.]SBV91822.1 conserved hypothetical protein [uncultured Dysgonomonas sp.]
MSKEEKAKEYAEDINLGLTGIKKDIAVTKSFEDYLAGYTAAEQYLSSQLTAYKEALRELVEECEFMVIPDIRSMNHLYKEEIDIDKLQDLLTKAKTLIE